jgi:hypothetical protein
VSTELNFDVMADWKTCGSLKDQSECINVALEKYGLTMSKYNEIFREVGKVVGGNWKSERETWGVTLTLSMIDE